MEAWVDVTCQGMLIAFSATGRFKLKYRFEVVWYPYPFSGTCQDKASRRHVEGFMFDVKRCEVAVVVFDEDLVAQCHVDGSWVDQFRVEGLDEPHVPAQLSDLVVNN